MQQPGIAGESGSGGGKAERTTSVRHPCCRAPRAKRRGRTPLPGSSCQDDPGLRLITWWMEEERNLSVEEMGEATLALLTDPA
jgi:hypothetical protein